MLQNVFSHRPPLYDIFDKAELRALYTPCHITDSLSQLNKTLVSASTNHGNASGLRRALADPGLKRV